MLHTRFCREFGIDYPILSAPLGGGNAGPELAASVSNAGGLGFLGMGGLPAHDIREQIRETRRRTSKPFGVGLLIPRLSGGELQACVDERVPVLLLFWGDVAPYLEQAKRAGIRVLAQVGSVAEARAAAEAGVDAIVAQGFEAGGHVRGTTALSALVPAVRDAVAPLPVVAAGGLATGRGLVAALRLGAEAVLMGTRFVASEEARAALEYKQRIVRARAEDTVHTQLFDVGWPDAAHRVLRNKAVDEWEMAGRPRSGHRPGEGAVVGRMPIGGASVDILRYSVRTPLTGFVGDLEYAALYAGESCGLIDDIKPAAAIVRDLVAEADAVLRDNRLRERTMSRDTDVLKAFFAAINRHDMQAITRDFDPQIVRVEPRGFPTAGTYRGIAEVQAHVAHGRGTWAEGTCEPEEFLVNGDKVVVYLHVHVRLHGATDWLDGRFADGFVFRNGKITEYRTFAKREEALEWAGIDGA